MRRVQAALLRSLQEDAPPTPPKNFQLLLDLFLPDKDCEAFLGDLQERYAKKLARLGKTRADIWYRKQVLTSLWPLFNGVVRRGSLGVVGQVVACALRAVGCGMLADAIIKTLEESKRQTGK